MKSIVLVTVLQRNRTNKIYRKISKRVFIIEIGLCGYGSREIPQSAICKLETQESSGEKKKKKSNPKTSELEPKEPMVSPSLSPKLPRTRAPISKSKRRWMSLFYLGPERIGRCPHTLVRVVFFAQFAHSNAIFLPRSPHKHAQK